MREEYKKIEWNDEDIIAFSNQNLIRNQELVKAFKESINYSSLGDKLKIKLREIFNLSQD